jgi:hypothetical protein
MIRARRPAISGWESIGDHAESGDGDETFREEPDRVAEPAALPDEEPCAAVHEDGLVVDVEQLVTVPEEDDLDAYEISTRVNNPGNDNPQVIEPLDHEQSGLGEFSSG